VHDIHNANLADNYEDIRDNGENEHVVHVEDGGRRIVGKFVRCQGGGAEQVTTEENI
jgi:hypothetical protein